MTQAEFDAHYDACAVCTCSPSRAAVFAHAKAVQAEPDPGKRAQMMGPGPCLCALCAQRTAAARTRIVPRSAGEIARENMPQPMRTLQSYIAGYRERLRAEQAQRDGETALRLIREAQAERPAPFPGEDEPADPTQPPPTPERDAALVSV
jgi:hypothetical protein